MQTYNPINMKDKKGDKDISDTRDNPITSYIC